MKKFLVALVAMFCVTAVSAQFSNVGVRFGSGTAITAQYDLSKANHIDGRIGFGGGWTSITGIYNWSLKSFDWTPGLGKWFFDAGVGPQAALFLKDDGGVYVGAAGDAKFGIKFNKVPIKLAIDYTPGVGLMCTNGGGFRGSWFNFGLSCVYCF